YCGIVPFAFALSLAPVHWLHLPMPHGWLAHSLAFVLGWIAASCLLALLYKIMTEGSVAWRAVWPGAIIASLLLILYEQLFPLYVHSWLKPDNYGAVVGFILIVLAFFDYLGFIVLLGMEITSWRAGQRETCASLPTIIHAVQVNRTLRCVAGPNAGKPSEDLRQHAAKDKKDDAPHSPSPARRGAHFRGGGVNLRRASITTNAASGEPRPSPSGWQDFLHRTIADLRQRFSGEHARRNTRILWLV